MLRICATYFFAASMLPDCLLATAACQQLVGLDEIGLDELEECSYERQMVPSTQPF